MNWRNWRSYIWLLLLTFILVLALARAADLPVLSVAWGKENIPILLYHRISPNAGDGMLGLRVTPKAFDRQMKYLQEHGYRTISLDQLTDHWDNGYPLPPRPVIITFDDGYENNYTFAFPILRKYGFNATIFLVNNDIERVNAWDAGRITQPRLKLLSWAQIREMQKYGISFQAHTLTHPSLTTIPPEQARNEINLSKTELEKSLGTPVRYLAYPYGRSSREIENMVRSAGYRAALSTSKGKDNRSTNRFRLKRLGVDGRRDLTDFAKMID